jgi:bacterioferritin-associated ferredoxin
MIFKIGVTTMIVCHCAAVTDSTIERLIGAGATSVAEIARRCGAGRCCTPCREEIVAMLYAAGVVPHTPASEPQSRSAA